MRSEMGEIPVPNSLLAELDGQTIASVIDIQTSEWTQFSATITVTSANPTLSFTITNPNDYIDLDSISANAVPTPGAAGLLALGGLVGMRRRRH